jgi:alkylation response protein AidB-like acyl-CoA dehydrogenase
MSDTDELNAVRSAAAELAESRYRPLAAEWDEARTLLPRSEREYLASLGYLGIALPEALGGSGQSLLYALTALEQFGRRNVAAAFQLFEANTGPIRAVERYGSPEQRDRYVPEIAAGRATMAIAISEPDAGSAASDLRTTATITGDRICIRGTKRWCSGAGHSELYLVFARLAGDRSGIAAVIVHADDQGVSFGPRESLHGFRTVATADIFLNEVTLSRDRLLDVTFGQLMAVFCIERLGNATMSLALAQEAFDRAMSYVAERKQFGRELIEFQAVHMALARHAVEIESARQLIVSAATDLDTETGLPRPLKSSMAKWKANRVGVEVTQGAMELMGGYGYHRAYVVERLHRDAHGWAVAGGTAAMQELRIAAELLGRRFPQRMPAAGTSN